MRLAVWQVRARAAFIVAMGVVFLAGPVASADPPERGYQGGGGVAPGGSAAALPADPGMVVKPSPICGRLSIGPVPGLTTGWHPAPPTTGIPLGGSVQFFLEAGPDVNVTWTGAVEVLQNDFGSTASAKLNAVGTRVIRATATAPDGTTHTRTTVLKVVNFPADDVVIEPIVVQVDPLLLNESSTNAQTMHVLDNFPSVAALRVPGQDQYRTSVNRTLRLTALSVMPADFAPLVEWRADGTPIGLGTAAAYAFGAIGNHTIAAGPLANESTVAIETYSVTITSHTSGVDIVPEGVPVTFEAATDPPGYEAEITWVSATLYGTAVPVLGAGPTFTVEFDDTWGPFPGGGLWQWLGVRADNAQFEQIQTPVE